MKLRGEDEIGVVLNLAIMQGRISRAKDYWPRHTGATEK